MEYRLDLNNLYKILELVSDYNCKLLPVIKGRNEENILQLYNEGFREFGEIRLNELKAELLDEHGKVSINLKTGKIEKVKEDELNKED